MPSPAPNQRVLLPQLGQREDIARPPLTQKISLPPRNPKVAIACTECKAKKTKCDANESCFRCVRLGLQCIYPPFRSAQAPSSKRKRWESPDHSNDLQVLELLKTAPKDTAMRILQNLRSGTPVDEIFGLVSSHGLTATRVSPTKSGRSASAPTHSTLEFCLNVRHANAFPTLFPLQVAEVDLRLLTLGSRRDFPAKQPKRRPLLPQSLVSSGVGDDPVGNATLLKSLSPLSRYVDPRLDNLEMKCWTHVHISDAFAARVLSFYLETEHPLIGVFHPNLFVTDLIGRGTRFCSPLLVSSLFAWACGTFAQLEPEARKLSMYFLDEAKSRWREEAQHNTLTSVSAAILLNIACNHHGDDRNGLMYLDAAAEMGRRLHLFDEGETSFRHASSEDDEFRAAASFAAWGVFGWHTLHYLYFRRKHRIHDPPALPIPGDERGPPMPQYMGRTFTWVCKFWRVVHEPSRIGNNAIYSGLSISEAEAVFLKLLGLFDGLPEGLKPGPSCPNHVLVLHIWYHTAVLDLWRPFLETDRNTRLPHFPSAGNSPSAAYNASIRQLKRLAYTYRHRFELTRSTSLIGPCFLYLINNVCRDTDAPEAQFDFILSIRGYIALAQWSPVVVGVVKAFTELAWRSGVIERLICADDLLEEIQEIPVTVETEEPEYQSLYPVDLGQAPENIEAVSMENLAKGFNELVLRIDRSGGKSEGGEGTDDDKRPMWTGDPRDLNLTLSEVVDSDAFLEWDP